MAGLPSRCGTNLGTKGRPLVAGCTDLEFDEENYDVRGNLSTTLLAGCPPFSVMAMAPVSLVRTLGLRPSFYLPRRCSLSPTIRSVPTVRLPVVPEMPLPGSAERRPRRTICSSRNGRSAAGIVSAAVLPPMFHASGRNAQINGLLCDPGVRLMNDPQPPARSMPSHGGNIIHILPDNVRISFEIAGTAGPLFPQTPNEYDMLSSMYRLLACAVLNQSTEALWNQRDGRWET